MTKVYLILVLTCIFYCSVLGIKNWGENCTHSDECFDHRMVCLPDENNVTKCICNRFHKWNGTSVGCIQIYSAAHIMRETEYDYDSDDHIEKEQEQIFKGPVYSVYFMVFVIATCAVSIIVYCLYVRMKDNNHLKFLVLHMETRHESMKRQSVRFNPSTSSC